MGLAAFVSFAWYVYKPNLDLIPDLSIPAVFASAAPVAEIVTSKEDIAVAPIEVWVAAPIEDPAALHTNSDKVDNLSVASLTQPQLLRLRNPFMRGPDVTALQQALAAKDIAIDVDGVFGSATEAAVIAFQEREGLTPNGIIGPDTRSRLR